MNAHGKVKLTFRGKVVKNGCGEIVSMVAGRLY